MPIAQLFQSYSSLQIWSKMLSPLIVSLLSNKPNLVHYLNDARFFPATHLSFCTLQLSPSGVHFQDLIIWFFLKILRIYWLWFQYYFRLTSALTSQLCHNSRSEALIRFQSIFCDFGYLQLTFLCLLAPLKLRLFDYKVQYLRFFGSPSRTWLGRKMYIFWWD